MPGFSNITGDESIMFADNASFDGTERGGKLTTNGQLWIGASSSPHVRVGSLTSSDNSITWTVGAGSISGVVAGGTTVGKTITGDSGGALSPTAGNWNILGGPGVTTSGSGSTLTINSVVFTDTTAATLASDNGYFATAAGTYTLPAAPAQGETVIIFCDTAGAVAVTANTGQVIRIGNQVSSTAGSLTSTARGDALTLRYRSSGSVWATISSMGNWTVA